MNLHPKYGYDMDAVPGKMCIHCTDPIGVEEYVEVTALARFGQMMFVHARCDDAEEREDDEQS